MDAAFKFTMITDTVILALIILSSILLFCGILRNERIKERPFKRTPGGKYILFALAAILLAFIALVIKLLIQLEFIRL